MASRHTLSVRVETTAQDDDAREQPSIEQFFDTLFALACRADAVASRTNTALAA